jgi:hypothetical protein
MTGHTYQWQNVILGYNLQSLIYAFYTGYPVIGRCTSMPKIYETFPEIQYRDFNMGTGSTNSEIELWHHLYMLLSMGGQVPFSDNVGNIRIDVDNLLTVTTGARSRIAKVKYNKLWIFEDEGVSGLPPIVGLCTEHKIHDWFNIRVGMKQTKTKILIPTEDFVREIVFYTSERIDGHHPERKDLCAVSYLEEDDLENFEHSSTMARFKVLDSMKSMGIRGPFAHGYTTAGNPKHRKIKIEFDRRDVKRTSMHLYHAGNESLIFNYPKTIDMLEENIHKLTPNPYIPKVLLAND